MCVCKYDARTRESGVDAARKQCQTRCRRFRFQRLHAGRNEHGLALMQRAGMTGIVVQNPATIGANHDEKRIERSQIEKIRASQHGNRRDEMGTTHQFDRLVFPTLIRHGITGRSAVIDGVLRQLGMQLPQIALRIAPVVVVDTISNIGSPLNLSDKRTGTNRMDATGRQKKASPGRMA